MRYIRFSIIFGVVLAFLPIGHAYAITSWDVANEPQMFLNAPLSPSATTLSIAALEVNGVTVNLITTTGGVLRLRQGGNIEDIYFTAATVNPTTRVVTMTGLIRNVCRGRLTTIVTCGNGKQFGKGTLAELTIDSRLLNLKANIDRENQFTGSGSIYCVSTSQGCIVPGSFTTVQRDAFSFIRASTIIRNSSLGALQYYDGSEWLTIATDTGSFINATEQSAGKVELANLIEAGNLTLTGSTNSLLALTPRHLLKNGSGSTSSNRIPLTNDIGAVPMTLGGIGRTAINTGALVVGQGSLGVTSVGPCSANQTIVSDGTRLSCGSLSQDVNVLTGTVLSSNTLTNSQVLTNFNQTGSLSVSDINTSGKRIHIMASGNQGWGAGLMQISVRFGSTEVARCSYLPSASGQQFSTQFFITVRSAGASGILQANSLGTLGVGSNGKSCTEGVNTTGFNTTTSKTVNIAVMFSSSNASNSATLTQFWIDSHNP